MKIESINLKDFKRFTHLKIEGIPEKAKLVVMIGPNGSGKSSVFDAMNEYAEYLWLSNDTDFYNKYYKDRDYFTKSNVPRYYSSYYKSIHQSQEQRMDSYDWEISNDFPTDKPKYKTNIQFHGDVSFSDFSEESYKIDKLYHVRTAYRINSPTLPYTINRVDYKNERRPSTLIESDEGFASNYWRLALQWLERSSEIGEDEVELAKLQNEIFGDLRDAIGRLFSEPQLILKNLGQPLDGDFFQFDKGTSKRFSFQNLASGEKAALDLLLDVIITKEEWDETIICIDEPEAHIHTKLQGKLLEELYNLIPDKSQLWIATHSIGMVRKAQDLWQDDPDSVVFLDFGKDKLGNDINFDEEVTITPAEPNPNFWKQTYDVALGDLAELVITGRTVFCEGEGFDEECYKNIFKNQYPEIDFTSLGARENVVKSVTAANLAIEKFAKSAMVIGIVDRDNATDGEIDRDATKGIRTLSRKSIESYLLDDEVLTKLCEEHGKQDKLQDLLKSKTEALSKRTTSSDDLKPIAQDMHNAAKGIIDSVPLGNKKASFMRDILAPLIQPGMVVYEEMHKDIFG
ncbi:AAA family ATPase [Candidatus Poribacteria bacterium]|nr:AAA family ATPase [Candidatus Poribacteria bacterium]